MKTDIRYEQDLESLLSEGVQATRKRESEAFDELIGYTSGLFLFGAGNLGRRTLTGLRRIGIEPLGFIDSNPSRWGQSIDDLQVFGPEEAAAAHGSSAMFVITIWGALGEDRMSNRIERLRQLGCKNVSTFLPLYWKYPEVFLPHYTIDLPHRVPLQADRIRRAFALMADDESRHEFLAQLSFRLYGDFANLPAPISGPIYFRHDLFQMGRMETFVDCGAFDGDTLSLFLDITGGAFERAIAFEPDPANFAKLVDRVSLMPSEVRERITLHQAATGEINERLMMDVGIGPASHIGSGELEVDSFALDSLLQDAPVTFIKMDIEGSELATLKGAQKLIRQNSPILTISAYHRQSDLWEIPLLIHGLNPNYSFHLRPHMLEAWDLVCYAIPSNRSH